MRAVPPARGRSRSPPGAARRSVVGLRLGERGAALRSPREPLPERRRPLAADALCGARDGVGINGILGALNRAKSGCELIQVRHEEMAAFMACAHAKFTGELGVCLATSGPGAIHLLAGMVTVPPQTRHVIDRAVRIVQIDRSADDGAASRDRS